MEENDPKNFRVVEEPEDEIYEKIKELKTCLADAIEEKDQITEEDALSFLELKDEKGERRAHSNLGCLYKITGDLTTAREHYIAALDLAKERGDKRPLGKIYNNLGNIYELETNYEEALNCNKERLAVAKEMNDQNGIGKALANLGNLSHVVGDLKESIAFYEEMLQILRAKLRILDTLAEEEESNSEDEGDFVDIDLVAQQAAADVKQKMEDERREEEQGREGVKKKRKFKNPFKKDQKQEKRR
ncbi:hypothetical protein OS493_039117 [Desmophyllum pertusum]|uniref:Tetratricopeptide repeat protein n=1 Tax=Desmophyllum pertusum TaxID=174260 RepID=A0A9W9Y899_9CNID|nr:hypothetical protein OS493_039117 [Desmophyllum pertusum]